MNKTIKDGMKKVLAILMAGFGLMGLSGCATSAERAARQAEQAKKVTAALNERHYKIDVDNMYPLRGQARVVSFGYSVEVRNDSLFSYLPYFGRAYGVPYGGGKGLNFSAPIRSYQEQQMKQGVRRVEIGVTNEKDTYLYSIEVFDSGRASVDVQARQRDRISYTGEMDFEKD